MRYEFAQKRSVLLRCIISFAVATKFPIVAGRVHTAPAELKGQTASDVRVQESAVMTARGRTIGIWYVFVLRKALICLILSTRACIAHCSRSSRRRGIVTRHRMHVRGWQRRRCRWRLQSRL